MIAALMTMIAGLLIYGARKSNQKTTSMGRACRELSPEEERLLALLVLYQKDQAYAPGEKRFLNATLAHEASDLALLRGLPKTVEAMKLDRPLPSAEMFPGQAVNVAQATLVYSRAGRL